MQALCEELVELAESSLPRISNEVLLEISLFLFLGFACAEIIGASVSSSLSLIGDAGCMSVDVITYICNAYVEWLKGRFGRMNNRTRYLVDVVIPSVSVVALLAVTIFITVDAVLILMHPPPDRLDVSYLYGYSLANFFVDIVCTCLFFLRRDVFHEKEIVPQISLDTTVLDDDKEFGYLEADDDDDGIGSEDAFLSGHAPVATRQAEVETKKNLNMMSAFAHVLGDTLRTMAMFVAAAVSTSTGIHSDLCDAWAAIAVSASILALCWPLVREIYKAAREINEEEYGSDVELRTLKDRSQQRGRGQPYLRVSSDDCDEGDDAAVAHTNSRKQ